MKEGIPSEGSEGSPTGSIAKQAAQQDTLKLEKNNNNSLEIQGIGSPEALI